MTCARTHRRRWGFLLWGLLAAVLAFGGSPAHAQGDPRAVLQRAERALASGDTRALLRLSADRIEITLLESGQLYTQAQARYVLDMFFREHPPKAFRFDEPSRTERGWFASGTYDVASGNRSLRCYVQVRKRAGRWELRELRILPAR